MGSLTGEHYISESFLKEIGESLTLSGVPWLSKPKELPLSALTSKILCERHNNSLSPLDAQAAKFIKAIKSFSSSSYSGNVKFALFNGHDIERWMIKSFFGLVASGNLQNSSSGKIEKINVVLGEIHIKKLQGIMPDINLSGLFIRTDSNIPAKTKSSFTVSPIINQQEKALKGLTMNIWGFDFLISTTPLSVLNSCFRPHRIIFSAGNDRRIIQLSWDESKYNMTVNFRLDN
jgi:hypothetical protein